MTRTLRPWLKAAGTLAIITLWALLAGNLLLWALATPAQAQIACGTRDSVIETIKGKYGEVWRGAGLSGPTAIFEIWASDAWPGTWTILLTTPNGLTCVMAEGDGWHDAGGVEPDTMAGDPV